MPSSAVVIVLLGYVSQYIYHDWVYIVAKGAIFTDTFSEQCFLSVVGAYCFEELELLGVGKSPLMLILLVVVDVVGIFVTSEWILQVAVVGITILMQWCSKLSAIFS